MNILFEESGKHLAGRVMSETDASAQVELDSGKRVKVKTSAIVLRFAKPEPAQLVSAAIENSAAIDLNFLWEAASDEDFGFEELSTDYFSANATAEEKAALLFALHGAPHYFQRKGKGRYKKAPIAQVQAALAGIERKKLETARIEAMASELAAKQLPETISSNLYKLLFKPDKNAAEYKALVLACQRTHLGPLPLLRECGAINDPYQFHLQYFFFEWFPKGVAFPELIAPAITQELKPVNVQAFSIDDSATTEIDDAFSVQFSADEIIVGIHIAAPAAALAKGDAADAVARARMSTVYMPGEKFTMLPDSLVQSYTLAEGKTCPALSLYATLDATTLAIKATRSALELVPIAANLRHDKLDAQVTEEALNAQPASQPYPFAKELQLLFKLAQQLKLGREEVRGKPERFTRPDYNFSVTDGRVNITTRMRGAPLDLIVSELMIMANSTWGKLLADCKVPGIYRSQYGFGAMMKTRMGTEPRPHTGLGVAQYIWATSPLRRYSDLVNQWQLIACITNGPTAALVAPFKPKDAELFGIVGGFEAAYKGYADVQSTLERYWTLRYIEQQGIKEAEAEVMRDGAVRLTTLPLVFPLAGAEQHARGTRVKLAITTMDFITLEVQARLLEVLSEETPNSNENAEEEEEPVAMGGVLTAVDVSEVGETAPSDTQSHTQAAPTS
jgi:exoribonuclease II